MTGRPRILVLFGSAALFGQERGNIEALSALRDQGCDVLCLIRNEKWSVRIAPTLEARGLAWRKVPYIEHMLSDRLKWVLFRNPIAFLRANWLFLKIVRIYRPTHIHAFNQLYVLNFLVGLSVIQIPMIYRAGDQPTRHNWLWRASWRFVIRRTAHFVANSRFVAQSLSESGVEPERISQIYNTPPRRQLADIDLPNLGVAPETPLVAFIGQISEHKGPHVLVEAFRELAIDYPAVHLLVIGRVSDWQGDAWARALRERVAKDPLLATRVTFFGEVEHVAHILAQSEVLVVPSLFDDPSPNVVMEAKQAGIPSIVFPKGGLPELVEHGVDGLVCREPSAEALLHALRTYLDNSELATRHGAAARASLERLGVPEFSGRWMRIYTSHTDCRSASDAPVEQ